MPDKIQPVAQKLLKYALANQGSTALDVLGAQLKNWTYEQCRQILGKDIYLDRVILIKAQKDVANTVQDMEHQRISAEFEAELLSLKVKYPDLHVEYSYVPVPGGGTWSGITIFVRPFGKPFNALHISKPRTVKLEP